MIRRVPVSEASGQLAALVTASDDEDVLLVDDEQAAVLVSARRYDDLLELVEDLKDRLSVHEREGETTSFQQVAAELDLTIPEDE